MTAILNCSPTLLRQAADTCLSCLRTTEITALGIVNVRFRKRRDVVPKRAPSKMYDVRKPTIVDEEEQKVLVKTSKIYRTQMKSILSFLKSQKQPINFMVKGRQSSSVDEQADLEKALEINDQWNTEIAKAREIRLAEETKQRQIISDANYASQLKKIESLQNLFDEALKRKTVRRANAIDLDNLDEELDKFLDGPCTDHGFAITKTGEKYQG